MAYGKGGYDCDFVEDPPKRLECPICLQTVREPHVISCCGNQFCRLCIKKVRFQGRPCPLCNEPSFTLFLHKGVEREVKALRVRCPQKELGCEWVGELGGLQRHENPGWTDPLAGGRGEGCQYAEVECVYQCGERQQRRFIGQHETEFCTRRPVEAQLASLTRKLQEAREENVSLREEQVRMREQLIKQEKRQMKQEEEMKRLSERLDTIFKATKAESDSSRAMAEEELSQMQWRLEGEEKTRALSESREKTRSAREKFTKVKSLEKSSKDEQQKQEDRRTGELAKKEEELDAKQEKQYAESLDSTKADSTSEPEISRDGAGRGGEATTGKCPLILSALEQAQAIKRRGNNLYKEQKFDEAIECYSEAARVYPKERKEEIAIAYHNLAAAHDALASRASDKDRKTYQLHLVVKYCTKALEWNKRYVKALTRRLKAYETLGEYRDSLMDTARVIVLDQIHGFSLMMTLADLVKVVGQEAAHKQFPTLPPLEPTKYLVKSYADSFVWKDDLSAPRLFKLWCGNQSESTKKSRNWKDWFDDELFVKAVALYHKEKYRGVIKLLTKAIELGDPVFVPHALLLRGMMYVLWRQNSQALDDFTSVVDYKYIPKEMCTNALIMKAKVLAGQCEMDKCMACFEQAIAIDPKCSDVYIHRARVILETGDTSELARALPDLEKAVKMVPDFPYPHYCLASTYQRVAASQQYSGMQMLELSKRKFEEALQKFPNFVDGLLLYSLFLPDVTDSKRAEEFLSKAVRLQPRNPRVYLGLGTFSMVYRLDVDKGISAIETAISVDAGCVQAYSILANSELQKGNHARSMELCEQGIQNSRSVVEMVEVFALKEMVSSLDRAGREYGTSFQRLASDPFPMRGFT